MPTRVAAVAMRVLWIRRTPSATQWGMTADRPAMPGVDAALRLLTFLAAQRGPVAAATVQRELGLPRSSTYKLLRSLETQGFVLRLPDEKRYGLGLAAFELSSGFSRQEPLTRIGAPLLARLVDRVGESAHLSVLHGRDVVYLIEERARNRPSLVTEVGVRLPADITASGRAMLALLPPAQLRALYPSDVLFASRTAEPLTYWKLRALLDETRKAGYATEDGDVTTGIASVAVGVADHAGWPVAAVAITFESGSAREELVDAAREVATELARSIRGTTPLSRVE
jgi:DNA-binding IclR family transcriptional regulator